LSQSEPAVHWDGFNERFAQDAYATQIAGAMQQINQQLEQCVWDIGSQLAQPQPQPPTIWDELYPRAGSTITFVDNAQSTLRMPITSTQIYQRDLGVLELLDPHAAAPLPRP